MTIVKILLGVIIWAILIFCLCYNGKEERNGNGNGNEEEQVSND